MATKRKKRTKYQSLVSAKSSFCKGRVNKSTVRKRASAYVKHAVSSLGAKASAKEKAKARREAKTAANRVLNSGCKMTSHIGKKKGKKRRSKKRSK